MKEKINQIQMNWYKKYKSNQEMMYNNGGQFGGYYNYPLNMGYYYPNMNLVMNNANGNVNGNEEVFQFKQVQRGGKEEDERQKYMNEVALDIIEHIERLKEELKVLKNNNNGIMLNNNNNRNVNVNKTKEVISKYESTSTVEDVDKFKNMSRLNVKSIDDKYTNNMMRNKPTKNLK